MRLTYRSKTQVRQSQCCPEGHYAYYGIAGNLSIRAKGPSGGGTLLAQNALQPELGRANNVGHVPPDQAAATATATKALSPVPGVTSSCSAVNHLLKSVVREIRTLRSVGTGGGRPPPVTRTPGAKFPRATHLVITISGKKHWLWRAVDQDGFVLDALVQSRRDRRAAERTLAQAHPQTGSYSSCFDHGQARILWRGTQGHGHEIRASSAQGAQQSRRELASANQATRADHEAVQIRPPASTLRLDS